jgi:hypothetical protein
MDHPRLYPPDRETFEKIKKICILARKVDNYRMEWKEICKKISEKNGMKLMEVEQLYWLMKFYYAPAAYGEETILL